MPHLLFMLSDKAYAAFRNLEAAGCGPDTAAVLAHLLDGRRLADVADDLGMPPAAALYLAGSRAADPAVAQILDSFAVNAAVGSGAGGSDV